MLRWWFKHTLKFPLYSPHTLLHSIERNCSLWITIGLAMSRMYRHRISKGELYLHGNYLKIVRSKYVFWKKFEILKYKVLIPPDEVFKTFVEVADDLTMSCRSYLALKELAKWTFSLILVQYVYQISCHSTDFLLFIYDCLSISILIYFNSLNVDSVSMLILKKMVKQLQYKYWMIFYSRNTHNLSEQKYSMPVNFQI